MHATILSIFKSSDFFVGLFYSSLIHDAAAAPLQCWKLLPPAPPCPPGDPPEVRHRARAPLDTHLCPHPQHILVQQRTSIPIRDPTAHRHPGSQQPQLSCLSCSQHPKVGETQPTEQASFQAEVPEGIAKPGKNFLLY